MGRGALKYTMSDGCSIAHVHSIVHLSCTPISSALSGRVSLHAAAVTSSNVSHRKAPAKARTTPDSWTNPRTMNPPNSQPPVQKTYVPPPATYPSKAPQSVKDNKKQQKKKVEMNKAKQVMIGLRDWALQIQRDPRRFTPLPV